MELTKEMLDRAYQSVMPKTKHEKRFYELFKCHTPVECARIMARVVFATGMNPSPVECARIMVEEEHKRWEDAARWFFLNEDLEKWGAAELLHFLLEAYEKKRIPGGK
jgi:hypothetical protein